MIPKKKFKLLTWETDLPESKAMMINQLSFSLNKIGKKKII